MKWYDYDYLEEIKVRRKDQRLYKFKEGELSKTPPVPDIEECCNLVGSKETFNLERECHFSTWVWHYGCLTSSIELIHCTEPQPSGITYEDKYKEKVEMLQRKNLYKYSDERTKQTQSVRSVLHDIALNLRMDYLPKRRWSSLDKKRSRTMIKAIDLDNCCKRRLNEELESLLVGEITGEDLRLLHRTI
ncbi:hypothetical protein Tco_0486856 [Tanacetum coccineum]